MAAAAHADGVRPGYRNHRAAEARKIEGRRADYVQYGGGVSASTGETRGADDFDAVERA